MASKKSSRNRIILSSGVATTIILSMFSWGFTEVQKISTHEVKIERLEVNQGKISEQIDDMHWFFIRDGKVEVPKKK